MSKRLYFMLPDAQTCYRVVKELKDAKIPERHMHAIADAEQSLEGLPKASTLQKSELLHGLEAGLGVGGPLDCSEDYLRSHFHQLAWRWVAGLCWPRPWRGLDSVRWCRALWQTIFPITKFRHSKKRSTKGKFC
jgi:hypothetical protein